MAVPPTLALRRQDSGPIFPGFAGGGEAGALVRSFDWGASSLGPMARWPRSLVATVSILLHSRHPMFLWWGPELIQFYNDAYIPSFGRGKHPRAMGEPGGECWPEIWPIISPQIEAVMSRGEPSWNEDHLVPIERNGRIEEVYWTYGYSPVYGDAGEIAGTLVVCTETTSRMLSERRVDALRQLSEHMIGAVGLSSVARLAVSSLKSSAPDLSWVMIYEQRLGVEPRLVATSGADSGVSEVLDWLVRVQLAKIEPALLGSTSAPRQLEISGSRSATGELVTAAAALPVRLDGRANAIVVAGINPRVSFDDHLRAFLEQVAESVALAHSRGEADRARAAADAQRNHLLLQAPMPTAVLLGPEHRFELANAHFCQMIGRADLTGKTYREAFPELVGTAVPSILDRVYRTGEPFAADEYGVALYRDGVDEIQDVFFKFILEPIRDLSGSVYGMIAVATDVTAEVAARKALERINQERQDMVTSLEEANRTKDEFLAMLGHELRNPLSPIVTALHLMKLRGDPSTQPEQRVIERQVEHLVRLVDDLLDVAKITRGKVELRRELLETSAIVVKAVEVASFLLEQREHHVSMDVPSNLCVYGDPVRLGQVVANLLTNAARYTPPGGHIWVTARREDSHIVVTVKDDGIGIGADLLPRIFDLFVQAKPSADRAEGGLGIGLALVKNLVAMHGGTVTARSDGAGLGSEFIVRLPEPLDMPSVEHDEGPEPLATPARRSRRVLIVDDNADAADTLGDLLRAHGHQVTIVNDSVEALALSARLRPDVAVLDIGMPAMDGYELATQMREHLKPGSCRLIALTGYGQETDRARGAAAGFAEHLVKPVSLDELLTAIERPPEV
jgi:signal transduction histidine kinase/CheY-like chemotaxis protein